VPRITITLEDERLSAAVQEEAERRQTTPSDLVTQAVGEWLESQEDAELLLTIEAARQGWKEKGDGTPANSSGSYGVKAIRIHGDVWRRGRARAGAGPETLALVRLLIGVA
jgi:hypothetical protein